METSDRRLRGNRRAFRVPGALWLVFGLLAMNFAIVGTTITLASRDTHFAVEADYYQRAVEWDASRAELARSASLGWKLELDAATARSASGMRTLTVRLSDRNGAPIDGARVDALAFHHGAAGARAEIGFVERGPGVYQADAPLVGAGLHEVRVIAVRGEHRFLESVRQDWADAR
jgi:nitrogen fixation protein FixH